MCPRCGKPLSDSQYVRTGRQRYKSCPECSRRETVHAYYRYDHFGRRYGGKHVQSWCPTCRSRWVGRPQMSCPGSADGSS